MKTRIRVEKSQHFERHIPQVYYRHQFLFWEWDTWKDITLSSDETDTQELRALFSAADKYDEYTEEFAKFVIDYLITWQSKEDKEKEHQETKVESWYKYP